MPPPLSDALHRETTIRAVAIIKGAGRAPNFWRIIMRITFGLALTSIFGLVFYQGTLIFRAPLEDAGAFNRSRVYPDDTEETRDVSYSGVQLSEAPDSRRAAVRLHFEITDINLATNEVAFLLTATVGAADLKTFFAGQTAPVVAVRITNDPYDIHEFTPTGIVNNDGTWIGTTSLVLRASGGVTSYPSDVYAISALLSASTSNQSIPPSPNRWSNPSVLDVTLSASLSWGVRAYVAKAQVSRSGSQLLMRIEREPVRKSFVYMVAATPVALLLVVTLQAVRRRREGNPTVPLVEVAIGALAVLPLRQVVVPSQITDITAVDLILAIELVAFVLLAVAMAIFSPFSSHGTRNGVSPRPRRSTIRGRRIRTR